jgi:hypothetical protein
MSFLLALCSIIFIIHWKLIHSGKCVYDALRNQGIPGEPVKPLIGQFFDMRRGVKNDNDIIFWTSLIDKHGYLSVFCLGPLTHLFVAEPDIIAEVLGRSYTQNYIKPTFF